MKINNTHQTVFCNVKNLFKYLHGRLCWQSMKDTLRNTLPPQTRFENRFHSCIFSTVRDDDLLLGLALFGSLSLEG